MIDKCCFLLVCAAFIGNVSCLKQNSNKPNYGKILQEFKDAVFTNTTKGYYEPLKTKDRATYKEEDKYLNTTELLRKYGLYTQEYEVTTTDGYILKLIRIIGTGPVIFLMHGLWGSSDDFVVSGPDKALAYLLANSSYDIWLGNARGNTYSKTHEHLSTEYKEYWDFTWNEIGYYDVPAMIDEALRVSKQRQITYIGHGQGTSVFFVMCSCRPEYNAKIRLFISFGAIAWVWHIRSPVLQALVPFRQQAYQLAQTIGLYELLPRSPFSLYLTSIVCSSSKIALLICSTVLFNLFGYDYSQIDYENLPVQLSHFPSGSSYKQLDHYLQLAASKRFAMYDLGEQMNFVRYNQSTPPDYPVENIVAPLVLFYADNDWLSVFDDVQILIDRVPNTQAINRVPHSRFNHFDYIWGKDTPQLVYFKVLSTIDRDYNAWVGMFENPYK